MFKKLFTTFMLTMSITLCVLAQDKSKGDEKSKHAFQVHQHVHVTLADGSEVEAIIHGHISKKKYYVRQVHSQKQGKVHEKYIRAMSESEIANLKSKLSE